MLPNRYNGMEPPWSERPIDMQTDGGTPMQSAFQARSKLPDVGTTIFTVIGQLAPYLPRPRPLRSRLT